MNLTQEELEYIHRWRAKYAGELGTNYKISLENGNVYMDYGTHKSMIPYTGLLQLMKEDLHD